MSNHIWNFSSVGGVKRVNLESGRDLMHLGSLDQKLWTALSCPVHGLEIDPKTLELIDADKDGKIRVPEIIAAVNWIISVIKNPDDLLKQATEFPLSAINEDTEEGRRLLSSARVILKNINKKDSPILTVEETSDTAKIFAQSKFNGDGVITTDTTGDSPELTQLLNDVVACIGSSPDRGGKMGISREQLNAFVEQCKLYTDWYAKKETNPDSILPFGEKTEEAYQAYIAIKPKIEDYFIRCRLAEFDSQATDVLNLLVSQVEIIATKDLSTCVDEIAAYPLSKIAANKALSLTTGINPAWREAAGKFYNLVINSLFEGKQSITEADWKSISEKFAPYIQWKIEMEGAPVESLGITRIKEILDSKQYTELDLLLDKDIALENEANSIILVDKLVRYYRDLFTLLKNFVTFYDFYSPDFLAVFQAGTLYIDQRSCRLCIKVRDMPKHEVMASYSGIFLIYCDCVSKTSNEKMTIVAALTNGDVDNLVVGRNAVFYDRKGQDWDATVVKIVDNPISIMQAFWSPYRRVFKFIETQVNKIAAEQQSKVEASTTQNIEEFSVKADTPAPTAKASQPFDVGKFVGIFAAIGLALGAIGSAIVSVVAGFMGLVWWKMPLAFLGIILIISGPPMIMAFLKLRKRNLAPLLDANGWAINARANVNIQFGNTLTTLAQLPRGARIDLNDPFTKKKRPYLAVVLICAIALGVLFYILWKLGYMHLNFNI